MASQVQRYLKNWDKSYVTETQVCTRKTELLDKNKLQNVKKREIIYAVCIITKTLTL